MTRMRLAIELYNTTEEEAHRIANLIHYALHQDGPLGLGVRIFKVDNEGRRVEE